MITRILDTNVLLDRPLPEVINCFEPCEIVIPFIVFKELDTFKTSPSEVLRRNSKAASNFIDVVLQYGDIRQGFKLDSGHIIHIELGDFGTEVLPGMPECLSPVDFKLVKIAKGLESLGKEVILISQDTNVRILGCLAGIKVANFGELVLKERYAGYGEHSVSNEEFSMLHDTNMLEVSGDKFITNKYFLVRNQTNPKQTLLAQYNGTELCRLNGADKTTYGIVGRNIQQKFFLDALLDPNIRVVTGLGPAGTGKTLLAIAAGCAQTNGFSSHSSFDKLTYCRVPEPVGKDEGFLPGDQLEKIIPWVMAFYDNAEVLFKNFAGNKDGSCNIKNTIDRFLDQGTLNLCSMTYMRGRSLPKQFIILDEAQNATKHEIKTLVTRAGEGTKIVILGDIEQIDNIRLNAFNNGFVHLINGFKGLPLYAHVELFNTERSELAEMAVKYL